MCSRNEEYLHSVSQWLCNIWMHHQNICTLYAKQAEGGLLWLHRGVFIKISACGSQCAYLLTSRTKARRHQTRETRDEISSALDGDLRPGSCSCEVPVSPVSSVGGNLSPFCALPNVCFCDDVTLGLFFPCLGGRSVWSFWASRRASHTDMILDRSLGKQWQLNVPDFTALGFAPNSCNKPRKSWGKQYRGMPRKAFGMSLLWQKLWK